MFRLHISKKYRTAFFGCADIYYWQRKINTGIKTARARERDMCVCVRGKHGNSNTAVQRNWSLRRFSLNLFEFYVNLHFPRAKSCNWKNYSFPFVRRRHVHSVACAIRFFFCCYRPVPLLLSVDFHLQYFRPFFIDFIFLSHSLGRNFIYVI